MLQRRIREIVAILIGIAFACGLVVYYQWELPKGKPKRVEARILGFDSQFNRRFGMLQPEIYASVELSNGGIVTLFLPNNGIGCRRGDLVWLNKYDNRYQIAEINCRRP